MWLPACTLSRHLGILHVNLLLLLSSTEAFSITALGHLLLRSHLLSIEVVIMLDTESVFVGSLGHSLRLLLVGLVSQVSKVVLSRFADLLGRTWLRLLLLLRLHSLLLHLHLLLLLRHLDFLLNSSVILIVAASLAHLLDLVPVLHVRGVVGYAIGLQGFVQGFYKVGFLFFNMLVKSVTDELNVFLSFALLSVLCRDKRFLLVKVVEVHAVFITFKFRNPGRFVRAEVVPVNTLEERMILNFFNTVRAKAVVCITHKSFQ